MMPAEPLLTLIQMGKYLIVSVKNELAKQAGAKLCLDEGMIRFVIGISYPFNVKWIKFRNWEL